MSEKLMRCAVLLSGGGRTLDNFMERKKAGALSIEIPLVIASRVCGGIEKARGYGVEDVRLLRAREAGSVGAYSEQIFAACREQKIELVLLAGFLSLLEIPDDYLGRVMNIHPSLIPAFCGHGFYGHHVHEAVVARGCRVTGCTVHFCDNRYDEGPIVLQRTVEVSSGDTADDVAGKVFELECRAYPEAIELFVRGKIRLVNDRVWVDA